MKQVQEKTTVPTTSVAVMGEKKSGHSIISSRFLYGNESPKINIEEETFTKTLTLNGQEESVCLNVYFQEMGFIHQYCQKSNAFMLVFSLTSYSSFEQVKEFYECIQENACTSHSPIVLVCCTSRSTIRRKLEELEKEECPSNKEIEEFSKATGCPLYYVDANSTIQVNNLFMDVVELKRQHTPQVLKEKRKSIIRRTINILKRKVSRQSLAYSH